MKDSKRTIFIAIMVCLSTISVSEPNNLEDPANQERVMHFPQDRSLGRLMIGEEKHSARSHPFGYPFEAINWEFFGQARGDMTIPTGKRIRLILYSWTWKNPGNLLALKELQPDDIYSLTLSPRWSKGPSPTNKCMPYVAYLTGLRTLNLSDARITSQGLEYLTKIKSLERLRLPAGLKDTDMIQIGKVTSLKVLYLDSNNHVTNSGLEYLSNLKSLEHLVLQSVRMTDEGLRYLSSLPSLNHLILSGRFTNDAALYLKDVSSLRILSLGIMSMGRRPNNRELNIKQIFNDKGMKNVSRLTQLEHFQAHWMERITDNGIAYLKDMPSLKSMDIWHAEVTDRAATDLTQMQTLDNLDVGGLTNEGLKNISTLQKMKHLRIKSHPGFHFNDESLGYISKLKSLESLSIRGDFSDNGMKCIAANLNLEILHISEAEKLTNKGLAELGTIKSLRNLQIRGARQLSTSGLSSLNNLNNLKYLSIHNLHRDRSIIDISGLSNLEGLTLALSYKGSGRSRIYETFRNEDLLCLANLKRLKSVQLIGTGIDDAGMNYLSRIQNLGYLNIANFGRAQITDDGIRQITNMKKLYRLRIKGGSFTNESLKFVEDLPSLYWLELTSNAPFSRNAVRRFIQKNRDFERLQLIPSL
ncbi:MAG: leucine-rich repeat domain-containing protein [Planctomycetota bacterium]|jgi:hypothetical protein